MLRIRHAQDPLHRVIKLSGSGIEHAQIIEMDLLPSTEII
jgi:hypothetical protein